MNINTRKILLNVPVVLLIAGSIIWVLSHFVHLGSVEWTDNAQIRRNIVPVHARIQGYVQEVRFDDFTEVKKGDTLIIIESDEYQLRVAQAEASLGRAQSGDEVMGAAISTAQTNVGVSDAAIGELEVRLAQAQKDYERYENLYNQKSVTRQQYEHAKTEYESIKARYELLSKQKQAAQSVTTEQSVRRGQSRNDVLAAKANSDLARLNLSYTVITAPCDGFTSKRNIQPGQLVQPGQPLLSVVDNEKVWIVANYKETQTANIESGMSVKVTVDAVPGVEFSGRVETLAEATGAQFAPIPTDNAAGNFIKIEQRIPVKITFTDSNNAESLKRLRSGMNVVCEVNYKK